jgi:hypothetical protein
LPFALGRAISRDAMPSHRGHQKKLEKKKKQRLAVQRDARASNAVPTQKAVERLAAASPFGPAFMSAGWKETDEKNPPLVSIILSRALPDGTFVATMCLVDRTCLGIKNAYTTAPLSRIALEDMANRLRDAHAEGVDTVSPLEAQSVIFSALDYAASLGFSPHRDFVPALVGPRPEALLDTPLAWPERPIFVPGPDDDVARIVRVLSAKVGSAFSLGSLSGGLDVSELTGL